MLAARRGIKADERDPGVGHVGAQLDGFAQGLFGLAVAGLRFVGALGHFGTLPEQSQELPEPKVVAPILGIGGSLPGNVERGDGIVGSEPDFGVQPLEVVGQIRLRLIQFGEELLDLGIALPRIEQFDGAADRRGAPLAQVDGLEIFVQRLIDLTMLVVNLARQHRHPAPIRAQVVGRGQMVEGRGFAG